MKPPEHIQLVDGPDSVDAVTVRDESKLVWLSQTTLSVDETMETVRRLREKFPLLNDPPSDDICYATQNRQVAVKAMRPSAISSSSSVRRTRRTRFAWSRWPCRPVPGPVIWSTTPARSMTPGSKA